MTERRRNMGGRWLWQAVTPASYLTFDLTKRFLSLFVSGIVANPEKMMLGTQRFSVNIAPGCSGLEGVGLILAFGVLWLLMFRRECRFPQCLLLLPFGVTLIFVLNAARIAALILIGNAGAQPSCIERLSLASGLDGVRRRRSGFLLRCTTGSVVYEQTKQTASAC